MSVLADSPPVLIREQPGEVQVRALVLVSGTIQSGMKSLARVDPKGGASYPYSHLPVTQHLDGRHHCPSEDVKRDLSTSHCISFTVLSVTGRLCCI